MVDVLLLTLPRLELNAPLNGLANLKSALGAAGFSSRYVDFNLMLWRNTDRERNGHVWKDTDLSFRYEKEFETLWNEWMGDLTRQCLQRVMEESKPKYVGLCLFSQRSRNYCMRLCRLIRDLYPEVKIVLGGPYAAYIGENICRKGWADHWVVGEGELALVELVRGNTNYPGVDGIPPQQINDLDALPIPDFSDIDFSQYPKNWRDTTTNNREDWGCEQLHITGSRGCVRRCSFCDIGTQWPKFRYRSGARIAREMKEHSSRYGIKRFVFTDSLVNGSLRTLKEMCDGISSCIDSGTMPEIKWGGQFICRSPESQPPAVFDFMRKAGCEWIAIGVESGSNAVRGHMNKSFSNSDLDYTMEQCLRTAIKINLLLMVGYPTETESDFQETLDLLSRYKKYLDQGVIQELNLGPTTEIIEGTPLYAKIPEMGIHYVSSGNWTYGENDRVLRIERWLRLNQHAKDLGYTYLEREANHLARDLERLRAEKNKAPAPTTGQ